MEKKIKELIAQMTLEEKAGMCSGLDFWHLKGVKRLGIPDIMVTDGPHGLRKQEGKSDHLGLNASLKSTCFPSGATLAGSWNTEMVEAVGRALGKECHDQNVGILLGPAMNIKRTPLCGRNFEYFSEDPYLSGKMASAHIRGVQEEGIGTCVKHFAANNQEYRRFSADARIDERTLNEIYLSGFCTAVTESSPWAVMCGFNKVNGIPASENKYLIQDKLKKKWGFDGITMTDWAGINDRVRALEAGLDLEMPGSGGVNDRKIVQAVRENRLDESVLDQTVERILRLILKVKKGRKRTDETLVNMEEQHKVAYEAAAESIILLKNDGILPIKKEDSIAVIGVFAEKTRFQGGGSSHINPTMIENALDNFHAAACLDLEYAQGFEAENDEVDTALEEEAVELAGRKDKVILYMGLPDSRESESFDRTDIRLPFNQTHLLEMLYEINQNIVVVLAAGSPVEMPWIDKVSAIVDGYLFGQAGAAAMVDILLGNRNPSGRLAETFPVKLEDTPAFLNYPGEGDEVLYGERIYVGYRYYDKTGKNVLFPFGHGLSYTEFKYSDLILSVGEIREGEDLEVSVKVKNTGKVAGKEVIQLYVCIPDGKVQHPVKELKGFEKIYLEPGEERKVSFRLSKQSFSYYSVEDGEWRCENGEYRICVGPSSADIRLSKNIQVRAEQRLRKLTVHSTIEELMAYESGLDLGRRLASVIIKDVPDPEKMSPEERKSDGMGFDIVEMIGDLQIKMLILFSNGTILEEEVQKELDEINRKEEKKNDQKCNVKIK